MICPQDSNKQYIIPTKKWLKPIEKYITDDINTEGLIMLGKFMDKEKVIVKITKGKRDDIIEINKIIKNLPNFAETYCSFSCLENFNSLANDYKDSKGFCNAKDDNKVITLEIMKKYKHGSLFKLQNSLNIYDVFNITQQLLLSQIHAYSKTGFLHNDTHLGNILIHKSKKPTQINYEIQTDSHIKTEIIVKSEFIPIISDFNEAFIYKKDISLSEFKKQFTLCKNIIATFNQCLLLLKEKYRIPIMKLIHEKNDNIDRYLGTSIKNLRSYYKKYYSYEDSKKRECSNALVFSSFLISLLDDKGTNYWFDV